ncbi:MAG: hypothetical protein ABJR46_08015 [Tateyamaria sp.]|uniref:hypothetical protein n=1 Tax=Tateyamaria sp. TaxID=1929288 RepID=UPI0032A04CD5
MKPIACLIALFGLAACGIDGEPVRPTANLGINIGSGGISTGATVGVSQGPLRVGVGIF